MLNRDELEKLSTSELKQLLKQRENDVSKYKVMQLGLKVTLNSAYGMIGNEYSRYYDVQIAEGITVSGQLSIQWIQRKLNEFLNHYLGMDGHDFSIAGDTDSIYLSLAPFVEKITAGKEVPKEKIVAVVDKFCEDVIQPQIDKGYNELRDYMNAFDQRMVMAREVIADRGIWRAKKNYALNVYNSEGVQYTEPKLKIMGMESVRSSTPEICRNAIQDTIRLVLTADEKTIHSYVSNFKKKFMSADLDEIAFPRGVSDIGKWVSGSSLKTGAPWHVKGAFAYNKLLREKKLGVKYRSIRDGEKVKILYLKKANPIQNNTIVYPDILPPEFELDKYVDRVLQYDKSFAQPVQSILDIVGWSIEKRAQLPL